MPSRKPGAAKSPQETTNLFTIPMLAALIVSPSSLLGEAALGDCFFWPGSAAISVIFVVRNISQGRRIIFPPHIILRFTYLAFAGVSVLRVFTPELSFARFSQHAIVVTSIVLPSIILNSIILQVFVTAWRARGGAATNFYG
jgi:hypothetical protein